jgi:predicted helicase
MIKTPRPHQVDAIKAVIKEFKQADRTHMVMACGSGKTATALWIAEAMRVKSILILVPSLALINQFMKEWLALTSWENIQTLAVCSDDTVTDGVEPESVLCEEIDFPVTNDPQEIRNFLIDPTRGTKVIFSTYQSARLVGDACAKYKKAPALEIELGIFDEAHKTAGYNKIDFGFALNDKAITINKRLFMTATPRHGTQRKDKNGEPVLLYSMDDEKIYGRRCYTLGFRDAINLGLICDYKVIISVADHKAEHKFNKDHIMQEKAISLKKAIAESGAKKIITFHSTINDANYFAKFLKDHKIHQNVYHINAKSKMEERTKSMAKFRTDEYAIMTNARCLTEGVDVPSVDMVAFMSPKTSKIDIVQAIGRALRNSPGKKKGYIFLPLLIDEQQVNE